MKRTHTLTSTYNKKTANTVQSLFASDAVKPRMPGRSGIISSLIGVLLAFTPLPAIAAPLITVDDTIAGLGTTAIVTKLVARDYLTLQLTNPNGKTIEQSVTASSKGTASVTISGNDTLYAGMYRIDLFKDEKRIANGITFEVVPDSVDVFQSTVDTNKTLLEANGIDSVEIAVVLYDEYGNPLPGRPVSLISSRPGDTIESDTQQTNSRGEQFFFVSTRTPGSISIRAIDLLSGHALDHTVALTAEGRSIGGYGGAPAAHSHFYYGNRRGAGSNFTAQLSNFDIIDSFEITMPPQIPRGEEVPKILIRPIDQNGNTVENYIGTVLFSSTDPNAILPNFGQYTFRERDLGEKEFPLVLTFEEIGTQVFRTEDSSDPDIIGEAVIEVTGTAVNEPSGNIIITQPINGSFIEGNTVTVEGEGPEYSNIIVSGGSEEVRGDSGENGEFSIEVPLDTTQAEITLRVQDDSGRHTSNPIQLKRDTTPPTIDSLSFLPEESTEEDNILAVLIAEAGLARAVIRLQPDGEEIVELTEKDDEPGVYQAFFAAPTVGSYTPLVEVEDDNGNRAEQEGVLNVLSRIIPQVVGLTATPSSSAISLEWEPVEDVDAYRIYVGETPDTFLYTLDTERDITRATVAGLATGQTYYFAVTALQEENESAEKSEVVAAQTIGLTLTVEEHNALLNLLWDFPSNTDVASFVFEYGTEPGVYTEQRSLGGDQRRMSIPDLINGVTYELRLTPVDASDTLLTELSQVAQGTPSGPVDGIFFHRAKPVPADLLEPPLPPPLPIEEHRPPLMNEVGSSTLIIGGIIVLLIVSILIYGRIYRRRVLM